MSRISLRCFLLLAIWLVSSFARGQSTELVSIAPNGVQARSFVSEAIVSKTGRFVLFLGEADLTGTFNDCERWWMRDREAGTTELISRNEDGSPVSCVPFVLFSTLSSESRADGRFVVYDFVTTDIDPEAMPIGRRVYLLDRTTNQVRRIGPAPNISAAAPRMDDAGNRVLMGIGTDPVRLQVFDLGTGLVIPVTDGEKVDLLQTAISGDGRKVVYIGRQAGLSDELLNQVYLFDTETGLTQLLSAAPDGSPANGQVLGPTVNFDGSVVAFKSVATNLVPYTGTAILARYVNEGRTELVSRNSEGQPIAGGFFLEWPSISDDGTRIAFRSSGFNLPGAGDARPFFPQVYVFDTRTQRVTLVSQNAAGRGASLGSSVARCEEAGSIQPCGIYLNLSPKISGNGRFVGFHSFGTNLIPNDINGEDPDVYIRDLGEASDGVPVASPVPLSPVLAWLLIPLVLWLTAMSMAQGGGSRIESKSWRHLSEGLYTA